MPVSIASLDDFRAKLIFLFSNDKRYTAEIIRSMSTSSAKIRD